MFTSGSPDHWRRRGTNRTLSFILARGEMLPEFYRYLAITPSDKMAALFGG
jgi:hypothetical protein